MSQKVSISKSAIYIFSYIILSAVSNVFVNHTTRSIDPIITLFYSSIITIVFFSILNLREVTKNIVLIKENKKLILWLNVFNAIIWFVIFFSLKVLSPAVFSSLFLGAIPINVFLFELRASKASKKSNLTTAILLLVMFVLMLLLVFQGIGEVHCFQILKYGSIVVFVGGAFATFILKISKELAVKNVSASLVVSLRFYGLLVLSFLLVFLNPTKFLVSPIVFAQIFALALTSIALPLFLFQKALKTVSPLYASILITVIPILTYFIQLVTGYYTFSLVKLGIIILFSLTLIMLAFLKKKI